MNVDRRARLAGAVWGHLIGDAVGVPYEFLAPDEIGDVVFRGGGSHGQPPGTWSDDGALMLALLDSLLTAGFDVEDQGRRFLLWADQGAYTPDGDGRFDIGGTTAAALERIRAGEPAATAGGTGDRDLGNGSLMRILPLALVDDGLSDADLVDRAYAASAVTHGQYMTQAACALYVLVARRLLDGTTDRQVALDGARAGLRSTCWNLAPADWVIREAAVDGLEAWTGRSGTGYVRDSFWTAWDAFAGAESYCDAVLRAVRAGNDTDTTACIAGGLAGLYWGIATFPDEWLEAMRGRSLVDGLVGRLLAAA